MCQLLARLLHLSLGGWGITFLSLAQPASKTRMEADLHCNAEGVLSVRRAWGGAQTPPEASSSHRTHTQVLTMASDISCHLLASPHHCHSHSETPASSCLRTVVVWLLLSKTLSLAISVSPPSATHSSSISAVRPAPPLPS